MINYVWDHSEYGSPAFSLPDYSNYGFVFEQVKGSYRTVIYCDSLIKVDS